MKKICIIEGIIIVLFIIAGILYHTHHNAANKILEQNFKAATDTIEVLKLKNGELLYEKSAFILKENELQAQLSLSKDEIKELKKKIGGINTITKIETQVEFDTIYIKNNSIGPSRFSFEYNDNWLKLKGLSSKDSTQIYDISVPIDLVVGMSKDYNIFVKTDNPYLKVNNIEGAVVDRNLFEKKSSWSHGVSIGFGIQYGLGNKRFDYGPQISYGFTYKF